LPDLTLIDTTSPKTRSRVSNARGLFVEADGRSAWARRFRDLCGVYTAHIGGNPTAPQTSLIRRIAGLDCELERLEGLLANGKRVEVDFDAYSRWSGQQRRLLEQLGFQAAQRDVTPTLSQQLAAATAARESSS